MLQIPLRNLSWRSAVPKIQLSTVPAESKAAIVNITTETMKSYHGEHTKDKVQTIILTDIMILATHNTPQHAIRFMPPATCTRSTPHASRSPPDSTQRLVRSTKRTSTSDCTRQLALQRTPWNVLASIVGSVQSSKLGIRNQVLLGAYLEAYIQAGCECSINCNWDSGVYLGAYTQAGWECAINSNWDLVAYLGACLGVHTKVHLEAWSMRHHV